MISLGQGEQRGGPDESGIINKELRKALQPGTERRNYSRAAVLVG